MTHDAGLPRAARDRDATKPSLSRSGLRRRTASLFGSEAGAAAVEFALIVPILLLLLIGIIEFGRVFNAQIELTGAAREGVRSMAIHNDPDAARAATRLAAPSLNPALADSQIAITTVNPDSPDCSVTLEATYPLNFLTGMFGASITLTGKSVMQCGS